MNRILVIQTAFIGDAILTLPMVEKLKEKFPSDAIDVLCIPSAQEIFASSPFVSEVIVLDKRGNHKSIFQLIKFANQIKLRKYSKIFSAHRSFRTSFIVMQSGVRETYGFSNSSMFHVYKHAVEYEHGIHEIQRNLKLIGADYTSENWRIIPKVVVSETSRNKIMQFISSLGSEQKLIAVAPGSVWETKKYPEKYYLEIISSFVKKSYKVIVTGSEADRELCERIASTYPGNVISCAGMFTITESIELLKQVKLLITNDSAPTHMGMCADIPALTIYCSTIPEFGFYPYNKKSSYISYNDINCKPCGIHGYKKCPLSHFECALNLTPQNIMTKIQEILDGQH
jgi:heptosyltransferase-2